MTDRWVRTLMHFSIFMSVVLLTRRRCAGCWPRAAPGRLWWRSHHCYCYSGSPGTVARKAGLPRTPWGRTPARTATSTSPPCPPPAEPPLHPSHRETLRGVQWVQALHLEGSKWYYVPDEMNSEELTLILILKLAVVMMWFLTFPKSQTAVEIIELIPFNFLW